MDKLIKELAPNKTYKFVYQSHLEQLDMECKLIENGFEKVYKRSTSDGVIYAFQNDTILVIMEPFFD